MQEGVNGVTRLPTKLVNFNRQPTSGPPHSDPLIDIGLPQSKNKVNSNQPKEICSHLTEKASKGRFPKPENGSKITVTMVTKEKERGKRKR